MRIKKNLLFFIVMILFAPVCKENKDSQIQTYSNQILWTWQEDQNYVMEGNIWNGFQKEQDYFIAYSPISRFAVWKKMPPNIFIVEYILKGNSPVQVFVNNSQCGKLFPAAEATKAPMPAKKFYSGLNILEFRKKKDTVLYIKNILVSHEEELTGKNFVIEQGEKVIIPSEGGDISLALKGRGRLSFKIYQVKSNLLLSEKRISNLFPSHRKKITYSHPNPFVVEIEGIGGKYSIQNFLTPLKKKNRQQTAKNIFKKPFPDIFIFLIDGCHVHHLSIYGYVRETSPNIDKLAKDSVVFDNAYSNAVFTRAAVATIFTGFYPEHHKVRVMQQSLPQKLFTLPEFLKKRNYRTSIFSSSANISPSFGFDQGVDEYFSYFRGWRRRIKEEIPSHFIEWLEKSENKKPRFSYVHFKEPHLPIIPPPPFLNMYKENPVKDPVMLRFHNMAHLTQEDIQDLIDDYDSTITYVDHNLGKIWNYLRQNDMYDNSMIIFLSDHGEALYEHKYIGHGNKVYDEVAHIPLILKFPSYLKLKGRVQAVVQTTDIFPTIARMFRNKRKFDGASLVDAFNQKTQGNEYSVSRNFLKPGAFGIRWDKYFYIMNLQNFTEELYDVTLHPEKNIMQNQQATLIYLRTKFLDWLCRYQSIQNREKTINLNKLSEEEIENLRSLGYIK